MRSELKLAYIASHFLYSKRKRNVLDFFNEAHISNKGEIKNHLG